MSEAKENKAEALSLVIDLEPFFYGRHITYVDVGAYHGELLRTLGSSRMSVREAHLIEPNPDSFKTLKSKHSGSRCAKFTYFHPYALSDSDGEVLLFKQATMSRVLSADNMDSHEPLADGIVTVRSLPLDALARELKLHRISLLKIDVEGAEMSVLRGAREFLEAEAIDVIYIEAGLNSETESQTYYREIEDYLGSFNYRVFKVYEQKNEWIQDSPILRRVNIAFFSAKFADSNPYKLTKLLFNRELRIQDLSDQCKTSEDTLKKLEVNFDREEGERKRVEREISEHKQARVCLSLELQDLRERNEEMEGEIYFMKNSLLGKATQLLGRPIRLLFTVKIPSESKQIEIIQRSRDMHSQWYVSEYPETASMGMSAAEHYVKHGAAKGYNPGSNFETSHYLSTYRKSISEGLNPLVHYELYGKKKGYKRRAGKQAKVVGSASLGQKFIGLLSSVNVPSESEQIDILQRSRDMHSRWYLSEYSEAVSMGMSAAEHYLKHGAAKGYNPGSNFETSHYLSTYRKSMREGLNPLVHYELYGKKKGYKRQSRAIQDGEAGVLAVRAKLLNLGFTEQPLLDLNRIFETSKYRKVRNKAGLEIALWKMRENTTDGYREALDCLKRIACDGPNATLRPKIGTLLLTCYHYLDEYDSAKEVFESLLSSADLSADHFLVWSNFHDAELDKLALINKALDCYGIPNLSLMPSDGEGTEYDRLYCEQPFNRVPTSEGAKVSVLLAAYNSEVTIKTALRALLAQTWENLEIIVIDDCSTDNTCDVVREFQLEDDRIQLVEMSTNGGAYVARNEGLKSVTGDFITIHDADDWSHPLKIEVQARNLTSNRKLKGCTTQQARITEDLRFTRFPHNGGHIRVNVSSFMFRREILDEMGCWLSARFGADSELIFRIQKKYGQSAVDKMASGPYSFQRVSDSSIVKNDFFGINGYYFGVRHELFTVSSQYIKSGRSLKYSPDFKRLPYPIPNPMRVDRQDPVKALKYDVVIGSDFRMQGGSQMSCLEELKAFKKAKLRCAIFCMYRYDLTYPNSRKMSDATRSLISELGVDVVNYGENVKCDLLILRYPPILQHKQRYIPNFTAKSIKVIVNQPPMSDYSENGVLRYDLKTCSENVREQFKGEPTWHPIGPLVRDALYQHHSSDLKYISLSDEDWVNIIDVAAWERPAWKQSKVLRIGRHSRDNLSKWPTLKCDILKVYPASKNVQVHILGGIDSILPVLGKKPKNWVVHLFDSISPKEFLSGIDVFVYFAHPDWIESFGRTIIEAMAVGVPVVLPEMYKPLFKEAALYATEDTAVNTARGIYSDKSAYQEQVRRAKEFVNREFSYEMNIARLKRAGVSSLGKGSRGDLPLAAGKGGSKELGDLDVLEYDNCLKTPNQEAVYKFVEDGVQCDFLWKPKKNASRLFVLFSGDAKRSRYKIPVFQRWKWADHFPGHCLYVSDPSLYLDAELSLAWYAGSEEMDPLSQISRCVKQICTQMKIQPEDVWTYGSSGGGFAALRMANFLPEAGLIAVNPQTKITHYHIDSRVNHFLQRAYHNMSRAELDQNYSHKVDLLAQAEVFKGRRIIYMQNVLDQHHYEDHYVPFFEELHGLGEVAVNSKFKRLLFYRDGGHAKAENTEVFQAAMDLVESF